MFRLRKSLGMVALLVGAAILGAPNKARADFELEYSTNGGSTFTTLGVMVGVGGSESVTIFSGLVLGVTVTTTSSGSGLTTPALTTLDVTLQGTDAPGSSVAVTRNLVVVASIDGVLTAPAPQILQYTDSASVLGGVSAVSTTENTQISSAGSTLFPTTGIIAQTGPTSVANQTSTTNTLGFSGTVPYTATASIAVNYTIAANSFASLSLGNNNQITPTPAPAGLVLLASGAPAFCLYLLRRRKATVQIS